MIDKYLKTFIAVGKCRNFTRAAHELQMTQAGVSRQIKALEESIGKQLLVRTPHQVILTNEGRELFTHGQSFLNWYQQSFLRGSRREALRIGCYSIFGKHWLAPRISNFIKRTECDLQLEFATGERLVKGLEEGQLDLIISRENINRADISSFKLMTEEAVVLSKKDISLKAVPEATWLVYSDADFLFRHYTQKNNRIIKINSYNVLFDLMAKGVGVCSAPSFILESYSHLQKYNRGSLKGSSGSLFVSTLNLDFPHQSLRSLLEELRKFGIGP